MGWLAFFQAFIPPNGTHIGGFDDLSDADASGKLDEILNQ
jgi:glutaredoxin-related protein